MKLVNLLLCAMLGLFFFSCQEDDMPVRENEVVWKSDKAPTLLVSPSADSLFVISYRQNGRLEMKVKFRGEGKYSFPETGTVTYFELVGNDVITNTFTVDPADKTSELIVSKWNSETKAVEATFQVTLKKTPSAANPDPKETLQFTGGEVKGTATVARKGMVWKTDNVKSIVLKKGLNGTDSLVIEDERAGGKLWIHLRFAGVRKYEIPQVVMVTYTALDAQGARQDSYYLNYPDPAKSNAEVTITEWNPDTKAMKGTFRFNLKKEYWGTTPQQQPIVEEYLEFSGGEFKGAVTVL
jgi:hypothetical protein